MTLTTEVMSIGDLGGSRYLISPNMGPVTGGSPCRLSILRNGNVACLCRLFMPMSHVEFKKCQCRMSLSISIPCCMSLGLMSYVDFKKGPCRHVEFRGRGLSIIINFLLVV